MTEPRANVFLPNLCTTRAVLVVVVVSELMAIVITLVAGYFEPFGIERLALTSLFIQWVGLTSAVESGPAHGSVILNVDGTFLYTPGLNFEGEDSFVYRASNGAASSLGMVTINVLPGLNDIPETQPDVYSPGEDTEYVRSASQGVLANDVDPDEEVMTATLVSSTSYGVLTFNGDGSFSYLPARNYFGK
mgnify:CR=1 FL=1